jgi:hypothetical protein
VQEAVAVAMLLSAPATPLEVGGTVFNSLEILSCILIPPELTSNMENFEWEF